MAGTWNRECMRRPERTFVVEFKGRRQAKAGANSIWGDTDFKALTREVEEKAPHLFSADEPPEKPDTGGTTPVHPVVVNASSGPAGDAGEEQELIPPLNDAQLAVSGEDGAGSAAEAVEQVQQSQDVSQLPLTPMNARRKRTKRTGAHRISDVSKGSREDQNPQTNTVKDALPDELAVLDAENKRLRRLLAIELHAQNMRLKTMLERCVAVQAGGM
ncbi:hypothetical protein [Sinorhizobium fredii]|nr:hypothetical protein [Sinorhizobium fredii]